MFSVEFARAKVDFLFRDLVKLQYFEHADFVWGVMGDIALSAMSKVVGATAFTQKHDPAYLEFCQLHTTRNTATCLCFDTNIPTSPKLVSSPTHQYHNSFDQSWMLFLNQRTINYGVFLESLMRCCSYT